MYSVSVQEIFEYLDREINSLPVGHMEVIDHLNEPVYLHPDALHGIYSETGKPHPSHNMSHTLPLYRTHQEAVE